MEVYEDDKKLYNNIIKVHYNEQKTTKHTCSAFTQPTPDFPLFNTHKNCFKFNSTCIYSFVNYTYCKLLSQLLVNFENASAKTINVNVKSDSQCTHTVIYGVPRYR